MAQLLSLVVNGVTRLNNDTYGKNIYADKFIKNGSSDSYVLLGGGGEKAISDFAPASHGVHWDGFTKRTSGYSWGTLTSSNSYTPMLWMDSTNGGGVAFSDKGGQTFMQIDGYYYQVEGAYRVTDVTETVTALGTSGNTITWTKNGVTNSITVPYATKATQDGNGNTISSYYVTLSTDQTITGIKNFNTATNSKPLCISRTGGSTVEVVKIGVNDSATYFNYVNDETSCSFIFSMENTDSESGGGAGANTSSVVFNGSSSGAIVKANGFYKHDGTSVSYEGHTHDNRYYTESEADGRFVNVTGDSMTGPLSISASNTAAPLILKGGLNNYREGLRIIPYGTWSDILLGGTDVTEGAGTSAKSWFFGNNDGKLYINKNGSSEKTDAVLCNIDNNWGIGTVTPNSKAKLHVSGAVWVDTGSYIANRATLILNSDSTANNAADIIFKKNSSSTGNYGHWAISARYDSTYRFSIFRGSENGGTKTEAEVFTISHGGNVGIGTTAPSYKLHLDGSGIYAKTSNTCGIMMESTHSESSISYKSKDGTRTVLGTYSNRFFLWNEALGEHVTVLSANGNLGIGTTSPNTKLHVAGNARIQGTNPALYIRNDSTAADTFSIIRFGTSAGDDKAYIFLNGPNRTADGGASMMTIRNNVGNLRLDNATSVTGLLTVTSSSSHAGIKVGNTYINAIDGDLIFQNNTALRFGGDSWDWNVWAGLKYVHSSKTIYLGLADNSAFTANSAQSVGNIVFSGIDNMSLSSYIVKRAVVEQHTNNAAGWYRIATLKGYFNVDVYTSGGWSTGMPSVARYNCSQINGTPKIIQVGGYIGNHSSSVRLGRISTNEYELLVYITNVSGATCAQQNYVLSGIGDVTTYYVKSPSTTSYAATYDLSLATLSGRVLTTDQYSGTLDTRYYTETEADDRFVNAAGDTMTGTLTMYTTGTGNYNHGIRINRVKTSDWALLLIGKSGTATSGTGTSTVGDGAWLIGTPASSNSLIFNLNNASETVGLCLKGHGNNDMKWNNYTVWHAGNDGSGSGLDADTVDGYHASSLWRSDGGVWNPTANITLGATANSQEWSFDITRNGYTGCYWHVWDSQLGTMLRVNADDGKVSAPYGFVGSLTGTASSVTVSNSDHNSTYRMVWHSGNSLYGTGGIYCNPSTDALYATRFYANGSAGPHFDATSTAGNWAYLRLNNGSVLWDIATNSSSTSIGANALDIRQKGLDYDGIAIRYNSSSQGKLVVMNGNGNETSIGYFNKAYRTDGCVWTVGTTIGGGNITDYGWYFASSGWRMYLNSEGTLNTYRAIKVCGRSTSTNDYTTGAIEIRESARTGAGTDNWATAPRLGFHWSGRTAAQIGLASNGYLYYHNIGSSVVAKLVYESGTWAINISGNAATASSATKLTTARSLWGNSFNGTADVSGSLHVWSTGSSFNEGIRMHAASNGWSGIVYCDSTNTGDSGTATNTWGMHNNEGTFYINKGQSSAQTNSRMMGTANGWTFGNTAHNTRAINTASLSVTTNTTTNYYESVYLTVDASANTANQSTGLISIIGNSYKSTGAWSCVGLRYFQGTSKYGTEGYGEIGADLSVSGKGCYGLYTSNSYGRGAYISGCQLDYCGSSYTYYDSNPALYVYGGTCLNGGLAIHITSSTYATTYADGYGTWINISNTSSSTQTLDSSANLRNGTVIILAKSNGSANVTFKAGSGTTMCCCWDGGSRSTTSFGMTSRSYMMCYYNTVWYVIRFS